MFLLTFTLHGLWPEYTTGGWPQFCPDRTRSPEPEPSTRQECVWPSLMGPSESFWGHEWTKHGTCAAPVLGNRSSYVAAVLAAHERYSLDTVLGEAGIEPSAQAVYSPSDFVRAVRAAYGATPRVSCQGQTLVEIWMCLDLDLKAMDCPPAVQPGPRCGTRVRLPPGAAVAPACQRYSPPWGDILAALAGTYGLVYAVRAMLARRELELQAPFLNALDESRGRAYRNPAADYAPSDP
ncbi:hypothetical protein QBZ16_002648 [Prototheca wickerhamii]|uniref:Uncharacterized protein n=1 Tax=Prototheca wickerhamii TaxID=3111 RepID=A0AAD9IJX7_PROWI|nr:hypothetical protein QBZ16_002648 [Prototheca wickerhamii]